MSSKKSNITEALRPQTDSLQCVVLEEQDNLPLLILPRIVLFPRNSLPLTSLEGLDQSELLIAQRGLLRVGVITRLDPEDTTAENPQLSYYGTEALVSGFGKSPENEGVVAVLKGLRRLVVKDMTRKKHGYVGNVIITADKPLRKNTQYLAVVKAMKNLMVKVIKLNPAIPQDAIALLYTSDDPALICDLVTPYLSLLPEEKLKVLAALDLRQRMQLVLKFLSREVDLLQISTRIQEEVRDDMQENLRRSFLREQMNAIKRELGELEDPVDEVEELRTHLDKHELPKPVREAADRELGRLDLMSAGSPEYIVSLTYLNWIKDLPWKPKDGEEEAAQIEIDHAAQVLDRQHYGLAKVKDRILDYLAVMQHARKKGKKGQILLFVGPPGVGKTSLAKSIAEALGRKFARISLGGVKDEAEIRGHRRTYIGSMPGRIVQALKEVKTRNPVILLDEIDKTGSGGLGDLASALLEVLDPEQNKHFSDHYLGFPYDLSEITFLATANSLQGISGPLLDRLEVIDLRGYTEKEKIKIAQSYIIPSIRKDLALKATEFKVDQEVLKIIIHHYTREAGVRQLQRELNTIGRKMVRQLAEKSVIDVRPDASNLTKFIGLPRYADEPRHDTLSPGVAIGLAYTVFGGDILYIESRVVRNSVNKKPLLLTGSLGKVMQESAQTVLSYLLSNAAALGIDAGEVERSSIHLHLPDGATPKDGPSAGIAILCALVSLFSGRSLRSSLAMTGEVTLRGQVLAIGGIKEKLIAAHRYGKREIILPQANWLELEDVPDEILKDMHLYPVSTMEEVLFIADLLPARLPGEVIQPVKFDRNLKVNLRKFSFPTTEAVRPH